MDKRFKSSARVFFGAGIYGIVTLLPQYFLEARLGKDFPPPLNHPEHFYGFIGVALAWQVAFLVISTNPVRYRPMMLASVIEKISFVIPSALLWSRGQLPPPIVGGATIDLILGVLFTVVVVRAHHRTSFGREIGLIGKNPRAMEAEKVPVKLRLGQTLIASGALAGAASVATVLGYKGYFEEGLGSGAGFGGLAVALLGRGSAVGLVGAALLFGTIQQGGLAVNAHVPKELMDVLQGVVICAVALADVRLRRAVLARTA
jgi:ABC-type uncharacterized transport system permease subunit